MADLRLLSLCYSMKNCLSRSTPKLTASLTYWLGCPPRERQTRCSIPAFSVGIFPGQIIPVTFKIGTPVATLPGTWCYRVSAGTGWLGILRLGEIEV